MPNYQKAKVYRLVSNESDEVYYGSTTSTLAQRLAEHKYSFRNRTRPQCSSRHVAKYNDVRIILVEDFPCDRKEQLFAREQYYIDNNPCVNKSPATSPDFTDLTDKQRQQVEISGRGAQRAAEIRYVEKKLRPKYTCECGVELCGYSKRYHEQSRKHLAFIQQQEDEEV